MRQLLEECEPDEVELLARELLEGEPDRLVALLDGDDVEGIGETLG